ncbi:MAG: DinB superfamily protein [Bacteroidota bacterium]
MLTNSLTNLYERDLNKVIAELNLYEHKSDIWKTAEGINNSAGNLALHLIGNLNTYIGAQLGHSGYVRDRPAEFSSKNIPRSKIITDLESIKIDIKNILINLKSEDLQSNYPENVLGYEMSTEYFLIHLLAHLNYHLGQINYHRRLLKSE